MTIKSLTSFAASLVVAASLNAQSSTVTSTSEGIANPNASITVAPRVSAGVRSFSTGNLVKSGRAATVGPFVAPGFKLDYKSDSFSFMLDYELESSAAAGFGKDQAGRGAFQDNAYFLHHPVVVATLNITKNTSFVVTHETLGNMSENKDEESLAITNIGEVMYKVNPKLSVSVGYRNDFKDSLGSINGFPSSVNGAEGFTASLKQGQKVPAALLAATPTADDSPRRISHSGFARAKVKFTDAVSTNAYVLGGIVTSQKNTSSNTYWYRLHSDTSITASKNIDVAVRARLDLTNPEGAMGSKVAGTGRLIVDYKINDQLTANLTNTLIIADKVSGNAAASFENEGYLGLKYAF